MRRRSGCSGCGAGLHIGFAETMSGSINAPAPNKHFKAIEVFIVCFLC